MTTVPVARRISLAVWLFPLILILEGYDLAAVGYAIPTLVDVWKIPPAAFTRALTAGNIGLMLGSLSAGWLGDRLGRKPVLLACVFVFGVFSLVSVIANSPASLAALRFLTGVGLGGALPTVLALASSAPTRMSHARFVILVNVGVPVGFSAGGILASWLVRGFGWRAIFAVGGVLPIVLLPILALWMPESTALRAILQKHSPPDVLFRDGRATKTLLLWGINLLSYVSIYFILLWMPALLHIGGLSADRSVMATAIYGVGVMVCPVLTALLVDRFGIEPVLTCGLTLGALCILSVGLLQPRFWLLSLLLCGAGIAGGCQGGINSLSALTYPQNSRSTGAGWALGVGRIGTIAGPLFGGLLLGVGVRPEVVFALASSPVFGAAVLMGIKSRQLATSTVGTS